MIRLNQTDNVTVTLAADTANPATYYVGSPASDMVAVADDEAIPTVSVANLTPSFNENETVTIPVTLSHATSEQVSIAWSTSVGTALSSDFDEQRRSNP